MRAPSSSLRLTFLFLSLFAAWSATPSTSHAQVAQPLPVVERIEPTSGPVGTSVQMIGRHFRSDQRVTIGGIECPITSRLPSRWTVTIPPGAQSARLHVRLATGELVQGPEFRVLAAAPPPVITAIEPSTAPPGAEVRIRGDNFSPRLTDDVVTLNGIPVVVRSATPTELVVIVPANATSGPFVVRVTGSGEATSPMSLTVAAAVTITAIAPAVASPGMRVTLTGTGFSARAADDRVFLNSTPMRVISATTTELVVEVPATGTTGPILVDVRGASRGYSATPLTVQLAPTVTGLSPAAGPPGAQIHVLGTNFGTDLRVVQVMLGATAMTIRGITPTDLTVEVPAGATSGPITVSVNTLPAVASRVPFTVLVPVSVASFAPQSGGPGTEVTITGTGFSTVLAENRVTLAGIACPVLAATATTLRVRIPEAGSGPLSIEVANNGSVRTSQPFVVTRPPVIQRFEPAQATVGEVLRILGANFGSSAALVTVTLAGRPMTIRSVTDQVIEVVVPDGATTGRIEVSVRLQGTTQSATDFRVLGAFTFSALEPASAFPAQTLTLRGSGFERTGMQVQFTGVRGPTAYSFVSATELRVVVPLTAVTGPLTLRASDGRVLSQTFTLAPTPPGIAILEVVPSCLRAGCTVIIRGYGFSGRAPNNVLTIGGQTARARRASAYELETTIPRRAAGTGVVHLEARGIGAADSPQPITIEP